MQISAQSLFTAIKEDPKQAKALIKAASTPDIQTANSKISMSATSSKNLQNEQIKTNLPQQKNIVWENVQKDVTKDNAQTKTASQNVGLNSGLTQKSLDSANKVLNRIFTSVSKGQMSKSEAAQEIKQNPIFKTQTPAVSDMKELVRLVQKEPEFSKFVEPLKEFTKHISTINGDNLQSKVLKSGVGFEAKLSSQTNPPSLPKDIKEALKELLSQKVFQNLGNEKSGLKTLSASMEKILQSSEVFKQDVKSLRHEIAQVVKDMPTLTKSVESGFKIADKLQEVLTKISPKFPSKSTGASQALTLDKNAQIKIANIKIPKQINIITQDIKDKLQTLDLNAQKNQEVKTLIQEIETLVKNIEQSTQTLQNSALRTPQVTQLPEIKTIAQNLDLQDKIKMLTSRIKQGMDIMSKGSSEVFNTQKSLKNILTNIDKNVSDIPQKQSQSDDGAIKNDIKHTLNALKDSPSKEISHLSNKVLANIETNQLLSFANNSISTYVPYDWDGLKEGSVAFKSGKDDSFFCQLDLNLKVYGRVNLMLMLSNDNYVSLSVSAEKEILGDRISENISELRKALNGVGLIPLHVNMKPYREKSVYEEDGWSRYSMNLKA